MNAFPYHVIDLTHTLNTHVPSWSGECGFELPMKADYDPNDEQLSFRAQQIHMNAGIGTHMDAPAHCIPGGMTMESLSLNDLIAPCVVISVAERANADYCVSVEDIQQFEAMHGMIPPRAFVIIHTGWEYYWNEPDRFRNNYAFPSISAQAAQFLLMRDIAGLGIDTLSPDTPSSGYPVHALVLGAGKYIVENVANAAMLPPTGSFSLALPIKIAGGVEAPMRLIALLRYTEE